MSQRGPGTPLDLARTKDGRAILNYADLQQYDFTPQRSGGRDRYFCPIHGGDHQRSLSVDPDTGKYKCHTCGETGTLRDHWPNAGGKPARPARALSIEEIGRQALAAQRRVEEERTVRLATDLPAQATAFIERLGAMSAALRVPDCPGAVYLRSRGLDPLHAASLGVGYAAPGAWPGDYGRRVGRIVYPLADPATGRIVSAVGRVCIDPAPDWTEAQRASFKEAKQRKLTGCPAGVWPHASIAAARDRGTPLVLVEGPADALALMRYGTLPYPVLALLGMANVLTKASLKGVGGVVLAFDADDGGVAATLKARIELALVGVPVDVPDAGWLGDAKDAGELAARCVVPGNDNVEDLDAALALAHARDALTGPGERLVKPTAAAASSSADGWEVIDGVEYLICTPRAVDPGPQTCIWCGTPTPGGVCCEDCKQPAPWPLHITGHNTTPEEMTHAS